MSFLVLVLSGGLLGCRPAGVDDTSAPAADPPGERLLPGPDDPGYDAALAAKADLYDRQMLAINAAPFGLSLDAYLSDRSAVDQWMSGGTGYTRAEFEAQTGVDLYEQVYFFGEVVDLGMFGGVAAGAEAYRYALLREGESLGTDTTEAARARVERAMVAIHMMTAMTGEPGVLVRGFGPKDLPGIVGVEPVPLFDEGGEPQPADKGATWREDFSGEYPDFLWLDDTSKDQWTGYVFAMGALWDVVADDPDIDLGLKDTLREDARVMGMALQRINPETGLDLTLFDADGRTTNHPDLNAHEIEGATSDSLINPFNAVLALAGLRVFSAVSGDPDVTDFYQEVAVDRGYAELSAGVGNLTYLLYLTNYSNVNMVFTALHSLLRFEDDPALKACYQDAVRSAWAEGTDRAPWHFNDAFFNLLPAAYLPEAELADLLDKASRDLDGFPTPPFWDDPVENCDEAELAAAHCVGVDGVTQIDVYGGWDGDTFVPGASRNEYPVATSEVPKSIRPANNYEWRSDPYRLNWGGSDGLYPGGDFRVAYWMGRYLRRP